MILYNLKVDVDYRMVLARLGIKDFGKLSDKKEVEFEYLPQGAAAKSAKLSITLDSNLKKRLERLTLEALSLMEPMAAYESAPFSLIGQRVEVPKWNFSFESKNVARILKDKQLLYLMLCTLGPEIESYIEQKSQESVSDAFILDAIASETVEVLANNVNQIILRDARSKGFPKLSMRYSPGYGDLGLDVQEKILNILDGSKLGIHLLDTGLMLPQKTITALIGAGK